MTTNNEITFSDHIVAHPYRYKRVPVPGTTDLFDMIPTWVDNPNEIVQLGTAVDRQLFEKLRGNVTRRSQVYTATANQTVFNLAKAYLVGQGRLDVYISGVKQRSGIDFAETSPTSFTLSEGLEAGTIVEAVYFSASQALSEDLIEQVQAAEAATLAANEAADDANDAATGALTANLNWKEPVNNLTALNALASPQTRDTRQTKDTGNVYRYDGTAWVLIQTMDPNAINALDTRLTTQLADIKTLKPNGVDDHAQIMTAIESMATTIRFTKGLYKIFKPLILAQLNNKKLLFEEGAEIYWEHGPTLSPGVTGYQAMILVRGCKNISIHGGYFYTDGIEVDMGDGTKSQWMHFFYVDDAFSTLSENILIDGARGRDFPGDFFELYGVKNVKIRNCEFDRCWRTGISPVKCEDVWIENNVLTNCSLETSNSYPGGINFEADLHEHYMVNIHVNDNVFTSNSQALSFTPKADVWGNIHLKGNRFEGRYWMRLGHTFSIKQDYMDVFIENNNFIATSSNALYQYPNTLIQNLKFKDCRFEQVGASSMMWFASEVDVEFIGCDFLNSGGTTYPPEGIIRTDYTDTYRRLSFRECSFKHGSATTGMNKIFGVQANLELIDCDLSGLPSSPIFAQFDANNNTLKLRELNWPTITVSMTGTSLGNARDLNLNVANSKFTLSIWEAYINLKGYLLNSSDPFYANASKVDVSGLDVISAKQQNVVATKAASQSIPNNAGTVVTFSTEDFDTNNMHDVATNNSRLTSKVIGKYLINANINFATNTTGIRSVSLRVNGTTTIATQQVNASGTGYTSLSVSALYNLLPNDYVEVTVLQTSGGALDITTGNRNSFSMVKLG